MATKNTRTTTPEERVADLEHELAALPALEAQALEAGDEDTLAKITARARILARQLAEARVDVVIARRKPIESELAALSPHLGELSTRADELEHASAVYRQAAAETRAAAAQQMQRTTGLRHALQQLDAEEQQARAEAKLAGLVTR